jgi:hypothetical protein
MEGETRSRTANTAAATMAMATALLEMDALEYKTAASPTATPSMRYLIAPAQRLASNIHCIFPVEIFLRTRS